MLNEILLWLEQNTGLGIDVQSKILISLAIVLVLWLLNYIIKRMVVHRIEDTGLRYQWGKISGYIFFVFGVLAIGSVWLRGLQSLMTYLGLLSAGLAVALKDPVTDVVGWGFIIWRKPFEVGDRIQIGEYTGDVIDIRVFKFSLMEVGNWVGADQSTGRLLHVSNGMIFTSVLANYTKGSDFIWNEIPVLITFESDWEKAKDLLIDIARSQSEEQVARAERSFREASNQYLLRYGKLTSTVYTSVEDSGVLLTIRYLCEPRRRRESIEAIWEDILRTFAMHTDIDFAYPTRRFYDNILEGKAAKASIPKEMVDEQ